MIRGQAQDILHVLVVEGAHHHGGETVGNDFLHRLIERFVRAVKGEGETVAVTGEEGLLNLEFQTSLLDVAVREEG